MEIIQGFTFLHTALAIKFRLCSELPLVKSFIDENTDDSEKTIL